MKPSNRTLFKVVDEEHERFGHVGEYLYVEELKKGLTKHYLKFKDDIRHAFLSHQIELAKPRKVLFLDIDGVCNSAESMKEQHARLGYATVLGIDPYMAFLVGKIQLDTECEVVLSSTWRLWAKGREDVKSQVVNFVDVTPDLKGDYRGLEIEAWLDKNPDVTRYAILDDEMDMLAYQAPNFFKTRWAEGITPEIAKAVTEHLNQ